MAGLAASSLIRRGTFMRKLKFAVCALLFGMISCAQDTTLGTRIDQYLSPFVLGKNFTGAVLVSEGDTVLYDKAYGQANWSLSVPNSTRTRFHIASMIEGRGRGLTR
jgi:CubicO group peptidase (beta-lactamase class C family)